MLGTDATKASSGARCGTALAALALLGLAGCTSFNPPAEHEPVRFETVTPPRGADPYPNWPLAPATDFDDMRIFETHAFEVAEVDFGVGGTTGVHKTDIRIPSLGDDVHLKVKKAPPDLDGINNAPRKELAAFHIQKLFLDPEDFVVPTTYVHCVPIELWRKYNGPSEEPNVEGADCVLIIAALWLQDVTVPEVVYDEERFLTDPVYAHYLSNLNVFTYVIKQQDARRGNFLVSKDDSRRQVFSIDNGSSFDQPWHNWFVTNWNEIRVAAVRKETIDRLRELDRDDLDFLEVTTQLELRDDGRFHLVPPGESLDDDVGALREGGTIQFGLTEDEIDEVWDRIEDLVDAVDDAKIPVF